MTDTTPHLDGLSAADRRALIDELQVQAATGKLEAETKRIDKETGGYPWVVIGIAIIASAPFWAAMAVLFGALKITVTPR